ncbi:MAG: phosphoribosylanthranilate isomerase [Coprococcus sp.]
MQVKICGLTNMDDVKIVNEYKPDYIGMVMFFPKSKRNIEPMQAKKLLDCISDDIKKVAVTVSPTRKQVEVIEKLGFDYLQIHGNTEDELITSAGIPVWKAFNISDMQKFSHYKQLSNIAGYVFDAGQPGSGKTFDWNSLDEIVRDDRLFILAGGLNPDNVADAVSVVAPDVVDVSSGVEYVDKTGKDKDKVRDFISGAGR